MKYGFVEGAEKFPKMVIVNVSYVCNAKCVHCVHTIHPSSRTVVGDGIFVKDEVFKKMADECGQHGALIRVTGTGKPLLHPNIINLIKYAKQKGCRVSMITNGSLLSHDKAKLLLDYGIDGIEFSVDAMSKVTYEKIRKGLKFEKLIDNISYLRKLRDEMNSSTNLIASFIEEEANRHERELAESFWVPKYFDKIQFRVWLQYGKMETPADRRNLMTEREPCPYPFERINMDSLGGFHLCAFDIDHETNLGSLKDKSVAEIWRSKELDDIRGLLLAKRFVDIPICSKCTDWGCRSWTHNFWKLQNFESPKNEQRG